MHRSGKFGPMAYDINSKAALASLHTGIGQTHLSSALSIMNIPPMSRACFKIRERETGKAVKRVAHSTCEEVMLKEKNHADATGQQADENNLVPISFHTIWVGKNEEKVSTPTQGKEQ